MIVLGLLAGAAGADPKQDARKHVESADIDYKLGKFSEALAEYSAAYELYPVPALLFNIGQCHRNLQHYDQALFFYNGFLRDAPADAPNRELVESLVKDTQADLDRQHAEQEAARQREAEERDRQRKQDEEAARARIEEDRRIAAARAAQQPAPIAVEPPIYKKWWFWPAVGGAAVALAGGVYLATSSTLVEPSGTLGGIDRR